MVSVQVAIPIIDFGAFTVSSDHVNFVTQQIEQQIPPEQVQQPLDRSQVVEQIKAAFAGTGFLYLRNHGIDRELLQQVFRQTQQFFELPLEQKRQLQWLDAAGSAAKTGYIALEQERLDQTKPGDLREAMDMTQVGLSTLDWSVTPAEFQATMQQFYTACATLSSRVLQALALAIDLPPQFFIEHHDQQDYELLLIHYPPLTGAPKPGQLRAGEHTDYGTLTFLFQHLEEGLEVQARSGEWLPVPVIPDTVVVNVGDLLERWTNGHLVAGRHRVNIPAQGAKQRSRYCVGYFCHPNHNRQVACLEQFVSTDHPAQYEPVIAGEYLEQLFRETIDIC